MPDRAVIGWIKGLSLSWRLGIALGAIALIVGAIAMIYHKGETAGTAKVQAQAEKGHAKTVAEARSDERQAQATVDAIGKRVAAADDKTTALVRSKISEIHDALDTTPVAAPSAVGRDPASSGTFDTGGVRASLNAVVDEANRAADAADAEQ